MTAPRPRDSAPQGRGSPVDWPTCEANVHAVMLDLELDCVRPKGHELDGEKMHLASYTIGVGRVEWNCTVEDE